MNLAGKIGWVMATIAGALAIGCTLPGIAEPDPTRRPTYTPYPTFTPAPVTQTIPEPKVPVLRLSTPITKAMATPSKYADRN